jgi:uncharacterized membrane protein YkoI
MTMPSFAWGEDDHERARRLLEAGQILPLQTILERAQASHPGRILEADLDEEQGRFVYEIELLDDEGLVWELQFDAKTGRFLNRKRDD